MPDLLNMRNFVVPEIIFGQGSGKLTERHEKQFSAKKVLIVSSPRKDNIIAEAELFKTIREQKIISGITQHLSENWRKESEGKIKSINIKNYLEDFISDLILTFIPEGIEIETTFTISFPIA